jgi:hypothetical protein
VTKINDLNYKSMLKMGSVIIHGRESYADPLVHVFSINWRKIFKELWVCWCCYCTVPNYRTDTSLKFPRTLSQRNAGRNLEVWVSKGDMQSENVGGDFVALNWNTLKCVHQLIWRFLDNPDKHSIFICKVVTFYVKTEIIDKCVVRFHHHTNSEF